MTEPRARQHSWSEVRSEQLSPGIARRVIGAERVTLAQFELAQGTPVPAHAHEHEQLTCVLEGRLRFFLGEDEEVVTELGPGEVLDIPPNLRHRVEVLETALVTDVFCPVREDWLAGEDAYLRAGS